MSWLMQLPQDILNEIRTATGRTFGQPKTELLGGGNIDRAFRLTDASECFFVKCAPAPDYPRLKAEAQGLTALQAALAVTVPRVISHGVTGDHAFLLLEYLNLAPADDRGAAEFGFSLARLHRVTDTTFGWESDNFIGTTVQHNSRHTEWPIFWREERLRPQLALAAPGMGRDLFDEGQKLAEGCEAFFSDYRPRPSLLHGDLWAGNWGLDENGLPVIFDPAVYFGDREAEIAMTELFGRLPDAFYQAYHSAWPLDPGYEVRRDLYNLYHVLNHFNLFGGNYLAQARALIQGLLAQISC